MAQAVQKLVAKVPTLVNGKLVCYLDGSISGGWGRQFSPRWEDFSRPTLSAALWPGRQLNEAGVTLIDAFRRRRPLTLICCVFVVLTCVVDKQVHRFIWFALSKHNPRSWWLTLPANISEALQHLMFSLSLFQPLSPTPNLAWQTFGTMRVLSLSHLPPLKSLKPSRGPQTSSRGSRRDVSVKPQWRYSY